MFDQSTLFRLHTDYFFVSFTHQFINGQESQGDPDVHLLIRALEEWVVPVHEQFIPQVVLQGCWIGRSEGRNSRQ